MTNAEVIDLARVGNNKQVHRETDCKGGTLLHVTFAGESFVICKDSRHKLTHAYGTDMDYVIEYLPKSPVTIEKPHSLDGKDFTCKPVSFDPSPELHQTSTSTASWFETATKVTNVLRGITRKKELGDSSCGCQMEQKPCLFVHGLGMPFEWPMTPTFPLYFGSVQDHMPCCSSTHFVHFNTFENGWTNPAMQSDFCSAALNVSGSSGQTIGKIILVTHSMGNLIAAGAVASNVCNMSDDVSWISSAGPMIGSKSANLLDRECGEKGLIQIITKPLELLGFCPPTPAMRSCFHYESVDIEMQNKFDAAVQVRAKYVTKTICGTDPYGLNDAFAMAMKIVGEWTNHSDLSDGMVSLESCQAGIGSAGFGPYTNSYNYLATINHLDDAFRSGDGWWGSDRKPLKWLECAL
jgi:hypothetical protein